MRIEIDGASCFETRVVVDRDISNVCMMGCMYVLGSEGMLKRMIAI